MTAPELKPCPFCGGNNLKIWDNSVECVNPDCGASGPDLGHCVGAECRAEAIAAWNTRAPLSPVDALVKASGDLKEIVEGIKGAMEHGAWRSEKGMRLKDTPEWVAFYNTLAALTRLKGGAA